MNDTQLGYLCWTLLGLAAMATFAFVAWLEQRGK